MTLVIAVRTFLWYIFWLQRRPSRTEFILDYYKIIVMISGIAFDRPIVSVVEDRFHMIASKFTRSSRSSGWISALSNAIYRGRVSIVWVSSVSIWSSRSENCFRRLGRSGTGRSGRSYGNQALCNPKELHQSLDQPNSEDEVKLWGK